MSWNESQKRYSRSDKGRKSRQKYQSSEKAREAHRRYMLKRKARLAEAKQVKETGPVGVVVIAPVEKSEEKAKIKVSPKSKKE